MTPEQQAYLDAYLANLSQSQLQSVGTLRAEHFCGDEYNANECARLVFDGIKTATCSLKSAWNPEIEALPREGDLTVVLNWAQQPVCIIKTTEVSHCPFNEVSADFAFEEGEGDRSYEWWYQAHLGFFTHYAQANGLEFNLDSELILERFQRVYPAG